MDFSNEMIDEILKIFQVESEEIISKLNNSLLELEKRPNNKDIILMLFRDAHSLKGASRMVGFNNVQEIAHKMEDILGLAKENKITINSKVVNVLYKTVDFLSELIGNSIANGKEVYNDDIPSQIQILEDAKNSADLISTTNEQIDFDSESLIRNVKNINSSIAECLVILMQVEHNKVGNFIKNLLANITKLYNIFDKTGPYDIKKCTEDMKVKLEFITKASNSLTLSEAEQLNKEFDVIINKLVSIYEIFNIECPDYYDLAFTKLSEIQQQEPQIEKSVRAQKKQAEIIEKIETTKEDKEIQAEPIQKPDKFMVLPSENRTFGEIKNILDNFIPKEKTIKNIAKKIITIIDYSDKNDIKLDEETISVIKQSFEYCMGEDKSEIADKDLILQRLEILQQVLELNKEEIEEKKIITPNVYRGKNKEVTDLSDVFDAGEIKTLRVDSVKLDVLVNQVNELTITKVKTKKHLQELGLINKELEELQKNSIKTLNYLQFYEKKYCQAGLKDSPVSFFIKQLLNLFTENNKKIQRTASNITILQKSIQEDDIKRDLIVDNVDNMVKNIRILPLSTIFQLFGRMVRDIAQEKNKKIDFEIFGGDTCTDKKIIEEIKNPLIHIIRNSIDHGIETPQERVNLGKASTGRIILSAHQTNNKVIIEIKDDGRGINLEKIKEKAVHKGFLTEEEADSMTDEQITNIIFSPGFSTGDEITSISGRGIGLDVVQTKITQLNGQVRILSDINKGCCVQIELPTTMSITKVFLVKSSDQTFAIPMEVIQTVLRKRRDEIISANNKKSIIFKNESIPLYNLSNILNLVQTETEQDKETILIIESADKVIALAVDKLIGDQEILIKKLRPPFYKLRNISGITTLDTGEICLILNIPDIFKTITYQKLPVLMENKQNLLSAGSYKILNLS
ncbi:MAG: chemotaxis protein CheA [Candidatus Gastranaerophilales bacterium]|nr:chemotaxis protein CheA [Candidatus Gastranaerophilales bacterium]